METNPAATATTSGEPDFDPFAGITDEADPGPTDQRATLLADARRGYVPMRKVFVQRPKGESVRGSVLAQMVTGRHQRPLDLLLLFHALLPILDKPLRAATWARIMSCSTTSVTRAFDTLCSDQFKLLKRVETGRTPVYRPLMEDGRGGRWSRPGVEAEEGPGYFTLPHAYWTAGWSEELKIPGKAMLLILLAETQSPTKPNFSMAVERAQEWYGISERTAERGYGELGRAGLMTTRVAKIADPRHPAGRREKYYRALHRPFRTPDRAKLQRAATAAARARSRTSAPTTQQLGDVGAATTAAAS
jgi:hypothetical protein